MWLISSSIGKKLIMGITGAAMIFFLIFHMVMNAVAVVSADAYNAIYAFLGGTWFVTLFILALGGLTALHIAYAALLTFQNRQARGSESYAVSARPKEVSWASQNMFVLGVIVLVFLAIHLMHFAFNSGFPEDATGTYRLVAIFAGNHLNALLYLVGFVALWFHLTHGFWSAFQSIGLNNQKWFNRWKFIGRVVATVVMLGYTIVLLRFYLNDLFVCCGGAACTIG